jgi:hypothetical protein
VFTAAIFKLVKIHNKIMMLTIIKVSPICVMLMMVLPINKESKILQEEVISPARALELLGKLMMIIIWT